MSPALDVAEWIWPCLYNIFFSILFVVVLYITIPFFFSSYMFSVVCGCCGMCRPCSEVFPAVVAYISHLPIASQTFSWFSYVWTHDGGYASSFCILTYPIFFLSCQLLLCSNIIRDRLIIFCTGAQICLKNLFLYIIYCGCINSIKVCLTSLVNRCIVAWNFVVEFIQNRTRRRGRANRNTASSNIPNPLDYTVIPAED